MFGPWLAHRAGSHTGSLGLAFLVGSISGFAWSGLRDRPMSSRARRGSAGALAALTALFFSPWCSPGIPGLSLLFLLGLVVSPLIVDWTQWLGRSGKPYVPLAQAMISSNVLVTLALLPGIPPLAMQAALAALPLAAVYCWPETDLGPKLAPPPLERSARNRSVLALGAFAVITYFVGGLWYRVYALPSFRASAWLTAFDLLCYMLALAGLGWWLSRSQNLAPVATATISVLGSGLALAQAHASYLPRVLLSMGLAGTDYYFWLALWALSRYLPTRRVFGWGLGFSLVQIALATLFDMYSVVQGYPREIFFGAALGVSMLLMPVVLSSRFHLTPATPKQPVKLPAALTDAEGRVFALLARGASDQDIANELFISRHTVKFHVRNILHKSGAPNRKVLLSMLRGERSATDAKS
jgi:DNA-binding CsgD family transcriptional regulator